MPQAIISAKPAMLVSGERMGDVGRELAAHALGTAALGHVAEQQDRAAGGRALIDGVGDEPVRMPGQLHIALDVFAVQRGLQRLAQRRRARDAHKMRALPRHAARPQQIQRALVDHDRRAVRVHEHEPLAHVAGDGGDAVALLDQVLHALGELLLLARDAAHEGLQLVKTDGGLRVLHVDALQRREHAAGEAPGEQQAGAQAQQKHQRQRGHALHERELRAGGGPGQAQHAPVGQAQGAVVQVFQHGAGVARVLAAAGGERLRDLGPVLVALHGGGVRVGVKEHVAFPVQQRHARVARAQRGEIGRLVRGVLQPACKQLRLQEHLLVQPVPEKRIDGADQQHRREERHRQREREHARVQAPFHAFSSIL